MNLRASAPKNFFTLHGKGTPPIRLIRNGALTTLCIALSLLTLVPLFSIIMLVVKNGFPLLSCSLFTQLPPPPGLEEGGFGNAIIGTFLMVGIALVLAVPIGILAAIYITEYAPASRVSAAVRFVAKLLTGVPSIVAALFVYALWVATLGFQRSGFAVSLALVLLMIPVIVRSTEEMLRIVPMDLREASYALGVPKWKTIVRVVIPTALSGIVTGILLALARVMGETAPLLILVGYSQAMNFDMFSGFMGSLPGMMYDQTSAGAGANPVPTDRLWAAALTLILLIAALNIGARLLAKFFSPKKI